MPRYRYQTVDAHGLPISDELEAARIEDALEGLQADGLHPGPDEIEEISDAPIEPGGGDRPLSTGEAAQFAGNLAELTRAQLPLGPGLRAIADELQGDWSCRIMRYLALGAAGVVVEDVRGRRLSSLFRELSRQTDAGVPLEAAIGKMGDRFPGHVHGLLLAGIGSGRLAEVLGEFASLERDRSDLSWRIGISVAYPLLMVLALAGMFIFCGLVIVPPMVSVFEDWEMDLPVMTVSFIAASTHGTPILIVLLVLLAPLLLWWLVMPRPRWAIRWLYCVPFLGSIWKWQSLVEFSRLMGILLARDVPMPEALRLTSGGIRSPALQAACLESAVRIEAGDTFSQCIERHRAFPATLKPFVDFGNQSCRPAEAFEATAEVFKRRIEMDGAIWEAIIPPLMLVSIGGFLGFMVISLLMPLAGIGYYLS